MKKIFLFILGCFLNYLNFAQSAVIGISKNGKYVCDQYPIIAENYFVSERILVLKSTSDEWKKEIKIASAKSYTLFTKFTSDNKYFIFNNLDTLFLFDLNNRTISYITKVKTFKFPELGQSGWFAFQYNTEKENCILRNIFSGKELEFNNIANYTFDDDGSVLLLKKSNNHQFDWVNLNNMKINTIWSDSTYNILNYSLDNDGKQVAFMAKVKASDKRENSIWYFNTEMSKATLLVNDNSSEIDSGLVLASQPLSFSQAGTKIFFSFQENSFSKAKAEYPKVDIWSYTDAVLQSQQLLDMNIPRIYSAVLSIENKKIIRLEKSDESILYSYVGPKKLAGSENYALVCHFKGQISNSSRGDMTYWMNDYNWKKTLIVSVYLVSELTGERKLLMDNIKSEVRDFPFYQISPNEKFIIYFNYSDKNLYSYEIETGIIRNVSKEIRVGIIKASKNEPVGNYYKPYGILGWQNVKDDDFFLILDRFNDIWKISSFGQTKPINLTNYYAFKNQNISWYMVDNPSDEQVKVLKDGEILLVGSNNVTKDQSIYSLDISGKGNLSLLTYGPYNFQSITKATTEKVYFLERESANEKRKSYYSKDLRTFSPIYSFVGDNPKGITQEILSWNSEDGETLNGILFKPLDFNSKRKYPVIFHYYEDIQGLDRRDYNFFVYMDSMAKPTNGGGSTINISYFVSHGYLVFFVPIKYNLGHPGLSVYNSVVAAAKKISKLPFVNSARMGIVGHSWGGYETNYLVTHTKIFAAACSGSGMTDYISFYGTSQDDGAGYSYSAGAEIGQSRIGVTPWERPDLYLQNSPIFYADRVSTPLLLMANKKDHRVPYSQGLELFIALRRMGKPAWLLQYDDSYHSAIGIDAEDFGIRMVQFFDHYLKGAPAPIWMTRGIPARLKGTTLGLEYDTTMKTPGPGLLMENEGALIPQQKELLKHKTTVNNDGRIVDVPMDKPKPRKTLPLPTHN